MAQNQLSLADLAWKKSSYSDGGASNCLETADRPGNAIPVRDSKCPDGDVLLFSRDAWRHFLTHQTHRAN